MLVENKLGQEFDSLAKRILYSYISTYPEFIAVNNTLNLESQQQMYHFMADTLLYLYENPHILGVAEVEDGYYENWEMNNQKPLLIKAMEKIEYKFADFIEILIKIGKLGEANEDRMVISKVNWSLSKTTLSKLQLLGIEWEQTKEATTLQLKKYPKAFLAWKYYSDNDDLEATKISRVITFIHARYGEKKYRAVHFFNTLVDNVDLLQKLECYLEANHFKYENFDLNNKTRYAYVKWIKEYSNKETASVRVYFDWRKKNQMKFEFRLPQFRILLNSFDSMEVDLKQLVFPRLKTCDHCGYCTQTDKTGKRPILALELRNENVTLNKCPLYPNFTWNNIEEKEFASMIKLFEFSERYHNLNNVS